MKIKNEFDDFFAKLSSQQKDKFIQFQLTEAEIIKLEMLSIENEEFEDYLFLKILCERENDETISFDEFKKGMNQN